MTPDRQRREPPGFEWDLPILRAQRPALRAVEIACAGGHNLAMVGPPGTGKTLLATRTDRLLAGTPAHPCTPPLRAPHYTVSIAAMLGTGDPHQRHPAEVARAHNGILFLDEIDEFPHTLLEALREPLAQGTITTARARATTCAPARFQLFAALNNSQRGQQKVEAALGAHLHIKVEMSPPENPANRLPIEPEVHIRKRIASAHKRQITRWQTLNQHVDITRLADNIRRDEASTTLLSRAASRFGFTNADADTTMRIARTIADLRMDDQVTATDMAEALSYRRWPDIPPRHAH